jgi:hypothetical protein
MDKFKDLRWYKGNGVPTQSSPPKFKYIRYFKENTCSKSPREDLDKNTQRQLVI